MPPKLDPEERRKREEAILPLLRRGLTNAQIAAELSVSGPFVKRAIGSMLRDYGVTSRTALVHRHTQETAPSIPENKVDQGKATPLTPGEQRIAELAATGLSDRQIAEHTRISMGTIRRILRDAYRKLGVRNRTELPALLSSKSPENPK